MHFLVLAIAILSCAISKTRSCTCDDSNDIPQYNFQVNDQCYSIFVFNQTFPDEFVKLNITTDCSSFIVGNNSFNTTSAYCYNFISSNSKTTTKSPTTTKNATTRRSDKEDKDDRPDKNNGGRN